MELRWINLRRLQLCHGATANYGDFHDQDNFGAHNRHGR
jgi:hypothetical protein